MVSTSGMMVPCTKVSGSKTRLMAVEFTCGLMEENIRVTGKIITCTETVNTLGRTAVCMTANTKTIENTDMESILGTTVSSMRAIGKMESKTEKESTGRTEEIEEASGKTARELSGWMTQMDLTTMPSKTQILLTEFKEFK